MNMIFQSLYYQYILDKFTAQDYPYRTSFFQTLKNKIKTAICLYLYNIIVLSMLYVEICPKVRRHNARPGRGVVHYAF
jgi:hypothetical protein